MDASLFKCLKGSRLRVRQARFNAALGKNPTPASGLHQKEFHATFAHTVTNRSDLLTSFRTP